MSPLYIWILIPFWNYHLQISFPIQKVLLVFPSLCKNVLSLDGSQCLFFFFWFFCLRRQVQQIAKIIVKGHIVNVLSVSIMISSFKFMSAIHFEFIFVYSVRKYSNFIILHAVVLFSQHHLLNRLSFLHCIFLPPLSWINWPCLWTLYSLSWIYMSVFASIPYCFDYCSLVM